MRWYTMYVYDLKEAAYQLSRSWVPDMTAGGCNRYVTLVDTCRSSYLVTSVKIFHSRQTSNFIYVHIITQIQSNDHHVAPQIFFFYNMCENVSRRSITLNIPLYTQCKLWKSCSLCISWPSLTPVNLPCGGVNRSLDTQGLPNRGSCVIKRWLSNSCLSHV